LRYLRAVPSSAPIDDFRLEYDRTGAGPPVVLLHGWPGDRRDFRKLAPLLEDRFDVAVPDLRGFGGSDKHVRDPREEYGARGQARSIAGLIEELGLKRPLIAGYDIGSRVAQMLAHERPELVRALVISPPLPGVGERVLTPDSHREFWYQTFHRLDLIERLIDGRPDAVRAYLEHFWSHWSGPDFELDQTEFDRLLVAYCEPGAFNASIAWYRAGSGTVANSIRERIPDPADRLQVPTTVLWPEHDPLFPRAWSDRLDQFFTDVDLRLIDGVGHFTPLEAPDAFVEAIAAVHV
jgi:pimeloyl-ACP methyl ester carboxylesterase